MGIPNRYWGRLVSLLLKRSRGLGGYVHVVVHVKKRGVRVTVIKGDEVHVRMVNVKKRGVMMKRIVIRGDEVDVIRNRGMKLQRGGEVVERFERGERLLLPIQLLAVVHLLIILLWNHEKRFEVNL
jgi:hypothetical protein